MEVAALFLRVIASDRGVVFPKWSYTPESYEWKPDEVIYVDQIMDDLLGGNEADAMYNYWLLSKYHPNSFSARRSTWTQGSINAGSIREFGLKLYIHVNGKLSDFQGTKAAEKIGIIAGFSGNASTVADVVRQGWRVPITYHGNKVFTPALLDLLADIPIGSVEILQLTNINQYADSEPKAGFSRVPDVQDGAPILATLIEDEDTIIVQARKF